MQADALLSQDELDFIQDMQHSPHLNLADPMSGLLLNGDRKLKDLLTRLVADQQVTLLAHYNNQQLSFPLQLVEDEFHALHLHLGSPDIFEDGPTLRPWRLSLDSPVELLDGQDQPSGLWVRDISFKGVLLELRGRADAPQEFNLRFAAEGVQPIAIRGALRRSIGPRLAAYDLSRSLPVQTERLREYILQAHRRAHPDLHTHVSR